MSHFAHPSDADWYAERGRLLTEMGRPREALAEWERARACTPDDAKVYCYLASCHHDLREYEAALQHADTAVHLAPEDAWAHRLRYHALHRLGRGEEALQAAGQAVTFAPDYFHALDCLACALLDANRAEDAKVIAWRLMALAPDEVRSWVVEARVAYVQGRIHDWEAAVRQVLRINPQSIYGLWCMGEMFWQRKKYREAFRCYDDALLVAPQDGFMWNVITHRVRERLYPRGTVLLVAIAQFGLALAAWQIVFAETGRWYSACTVSAILLLVCLPTSYQPHWYAFLWRRCAFCEVPPLTRRRWWQAKLFCSAPVVPGFSLRFLALWSVSVTVLSVVRSAVLKTEPTRWWSWSMLVWAPVVIADFAVTTYMNQTGGVTTGKEKTARHSGVNESQHLESSGA